MLLAERDVLDECYDAVFDPAAWQRVAAIIDYHCPELLAAFHMEAAGPDGNIQQIHGPGLDPDIVKRYPRYAEVNRFKPAILGTPVGGVGLSSDYAHPDEIAKTLFYADILKPLGDVRIGMGTILARQPNAFAAFSLHHNHALAERTLGPALQLLRRTATHLHRAFQLSIRAEALTRRAAEESLVTALALPVLATDEAGRIVQHNAAAEPVLNAGIVRGTAGQIELPRHADTSAVEAAVLRTAREQTAVGLSVTAWNGSQLWLHCIPLRVTEHNNNPLRVFSEQRPARVLIYVGGFRPADGLAGS